MSNQKSQNLNGILKRLLADCESIQLDFQYSISALNRNIRTYMALNARAEGFVSYPDGMGTILPINILCPKNLTPIETNAVLKATGIEIEFRDMPGSIRYGWTAEDDGLYYLYLAPNLSFLQRNRDRLTQSKILPHDSGNDTLPNSKWLSSIGNRLSLSILLDAYAYIRPDFARRRRRHES